MKITNTTTRQLGLNPSTVIPALGYRDDIPDDLIERSMNSKFVQHLFSTGALVSDGEWMKAGAEDLGSKGQTDTIEGSDRKVRIITAIRLLEGDDFTKDGLPKTSAIEALLDDDFGQVPADERDAIWAELQAAE